MDFNKLQDNQNLQSFNLFDMWLANLWAKSFERNSFEYLRLEDFQSKLHGFLVKCNEQMLIIVTVKFKVLMHSNFLEFYYKTIWCLSFYFNPLRYEYSIYILLVIYYWLLIIKYSSLYIKVNKLKIRMFNPILEMVVIRNRIIHIWFDASN